MSVLLRVCQPLLLALWFAQRGLTVASIAFLIKEDLHIAVVAGYVGIGLAVLSLLGVALIAGLGSFHVEHIFFPFLPFLRFRCDIAAPKTIGSYRALNDIDDFRETQVASPHCDDRLITTKISDWDPLNDWRGPLIDAAVTVLWHLFFAAVVFARVPLSPSASQLLGAAVLCDVAYLVLIFGAVACALAPSNVTALFMSASILFDVSSLAYMLTNALAPSTAPDKTVFSLSWVGIAWLCRCALILLFAIYSAGAWLKSTFDGWSDLNCKRRAVLCLYVIVDIWAFVPGVLWLQTLNLSYVFLWYALLFENGVGPHGRAAAEFCADEERAMYLHTYLADRYHRPFSGRQSYLFSLEYAFDLATEKLRSRASCVYGSAVLECLYMQVLPVLGVLSIAFPVVHAVFECLRLSGLSAPWLQVPLLASWASGLVIALVTAYPSWRTVRLLLPLLSRRTTTSNIEAAAKAYVGRIGVAALLSKAIPNSTVPIEVVDSAVAAYLTVGDVKLTWRDAEDV